jgi:hypothetical protein
MKFTADAMSNALVELLLLLLLDSTEYNKTIRFSQLLPVFSKMSNIMLPFPFYTLMLLFYSLLCILMCMAEH